MGLLSFFKRDQSPSEPADAVQQARTRARQRLIGATVLLGIGIVAFPLLFETQPRPIPVDLPIEIPRKEGAPPLALPAPRASQPAAAPTPVDREVITERSADAGREVTSPVAAASRPAAPKPVASAPTKPSTEAARAQALLDGKAGAEVPGRFIVQVGAFADTKAATDTRQKLEKLGLKTYTQVVETASGSRTRVRVGPFASRDEADRALAKAREAGINAVVLTL